MIFCFFFRDLAETRANMQSALRQTQLNGTSYSRGAGGENGDEDQQMQDADTPQVFTKTGMTDGLRDTIENHSKVCSFL